MSLIDHPYVLVAVLGIVPPLILLKRWFQPHPIPGIPHFPITSVWGDIPAIGKETEQRGTFMEPGGLVEKGINEFGPFFQILLGPFTSLVCICDSQEIEDLLLRSKLQKAIDSSDITLGMFSGVIPLGMVSLKTDDVWRRHRRITTPLMTSTYLSQMSPAISSNAQNLVYFWKQKMAATQAYGGTCFSSQTDFEYSTLDTISEMIVGHPMKAVNHALSQLANCVPVIDKYGGATFELSHQPLLAALRYIIGLIGTAARMPPVVAKWWYKYVGLTPTFRRNMRVISDHLKAGAQEAHQVLKEAAAIGEEPPPARSMVGMVVQRENTPGAEKLSPKELHDEALAFLLAGHDTTSQSFQWCVKFLAHSPRVQRALRHELLSALVDSPDKRPITFADVSSPEKTPYLEAVLYELLRCGKVAVATSKIALEPVTILGHHIPVGTNLIFMNAMSGDRVTVANQSKLRELDPVRSESSLRVGLGGRGLWTDPEAFNPDRWLVDDGAGKMKFNAKAGVSVPFGVGLRSCPGKALAQLELKIFIATLNLAFFFEPVPEELDSFKPTSGISRAPSQAYVSPRPWKGSD